MSAMVSQITCVSIVCSAACSADERKYQSSALLDFVRGIHRYPSATGGFPSQRAGDAKNSSIWWRHRYITSYVIRYFTWSPMMIITCARKWHFRFPSLGYIPIDIRCWSWIKHIKAVTKWPTFRRRHNQMHFLEWKYVNFDYYLTEMCS